MPAYDWSTEHKAFIKKCSAKTCSTVLFIGTENEVESHSIFANHFYHSVSHKGGADGFTSRCKSCDYAYERMRSGVIGLTNDTIRTLLKDQNGKCAICQREIEPGKISTVNKLPAQLDHDHRTGEIRELLCQKCNGGLYFVEDEEWYRKALSYLAKHKAKNESRGHKQTRPKAPKCR